MHYTLSSVLCHHPTSQTALVVLVLLSLVQPTLFIERPSGISRVTVNSQYPTCHALQPRSSSVVLVIRTNKWWFPVGVNRHPACDNISRLNHFSLRLRPIVLRPPCLTFGVTSACPMLATRWLTNLTGAGIPPAGTNDLARPHTPFFDLVE